MRTDVARYTVERLMRKARLRGVVRGKVVRTTIPATSFTRPRCCTEYGEVDRQTALASQVVVKRIDYQVPDAAAGIAWLKSQVGKRYDFAGALGLGIAPYREWAAPDA